ncbi:MAG: GH3 auxin-responsive promoter family protein [Bernardetiaceae bacterium]|nr:GH3 auxin-responsive promoter family protein [Bernardetiaceae bacterium]
MREIVNWLGNKMLTRRIVRIEEFIAEPYRTQERVFQYLLRRGQHTWWGKKYGYHEINNLETFKARVPAYTYEEFYPYIERVLKGEPNVLWDTPIKHFSKSSGTTNARSKFIPVSDEALQDCHYAAGKDMLALYFHNNPETKLFTGKGLAVGGSSHPNPYNDKTYCGDVSALIMLNLPIWAEYMRTPSMDIALMDKWEDKILKMAEATRHEDVTSIQGVPTWTIFLIQKVLELSGKSDILDVWENLECFFHGAVSFEPYRSLFRNEIVRSPNMRYMEVYNASEGFFGLQDRSDLHEMLLLLDHGVYYEFAPLDQADEMFPKTLSLDEVQLDTKYAMIISTNAGLWRYKIGDTIKFTSKNPYRIRITGRTKHFINAFGEELVIENADYAIAQACQATGAEIKDFTAAPIYFGEKQEKGGHEWIIEFIKKPDITEKFVAKLDESLRQINSDYDAKRTANIALMPPKLHIAPSNTFYNWMKKRGKLGGQNKVPRLANSREYIDDILPMLINN